jgi:hypothetical protein
MLFKSRVHSCIHFAAIFAALAGMTVDADARKRRHVAVQRAAAVTGLAASHDLRREGGRLCFSDHTHYGSSMGQSNERTAQAAAAQSWSEFVDLEYGGAWSRYASASGKDMKCSQSSAGWGCELSARPCR